MESFTATNSKGDGFDRKSIQKVNAAMFKIYVMELEDHHAVLLSKKSPSEREYTVIIPKADIMGSRFGMCACGYPKKEGIPCNQIVAISKLGRIDGLSSFMDCGHASLVTTEQWCNQFPEDTFIDMHKTIKSIKAKLTPQDDICYCPTWAAHQKKGRPKKAMRRKSIADHIKQLAKKKRRITKATKTPGVSGFGR
jgi:hypothetical protein